MVKRSVAMLVASSLFAIGSGVAQAQSSPTTCAPGTLDDVNVLVNGRATTIESTPSGILVNGTFCGWQDEIANLVVTGGALNDRITVRGHFIPGIEPEPDFDELEVLMDLGAGTDTVTVELFESDDAIRLSSSGINVNYVEALDNDSDIVFSNVEVVKVMTMGGDDAVNAQASMLPTVYLYGGDGNDELRGSLYVDNIIDGGAGNDAMFGSTQADVFIGGPGTDTYDAGPGIDTVDYSDHTTPLSVTIGNGVADDGAAGENEDVPADVESVVGGKAADVLVGNAGNNTLDGGGGSDALDGGPGSDLLIGGPGNDTVDYSSRTSDLNVSIGNGSSDDGGSEDVGGGAPGDNVDGTVENVTGGSGNDTLTGSTAKNILRGGAGNDTLQGGDGNDSLYGDDGDDSLLGEDGADKLYGGLGSDVLDGGADADVYSAGGGNDFLYNDDGVAETVNCGGGNADDAEVDSGATDTFIGCEL